MKWIIFGRGCENDAQTAKRVWLWLDFGNLNSRRISWTVFLFGIFVIRKNSIPICHLWQVQSMMSSWIFPNKFPTENATNSQFVWAKVDSVRMFCIICYRKWSAIRSKWAYGSHLINSWGTLVHLFHLNYHVIPRYQIK